MARRSRPTKLPAPFLGRLTLKGDKNDFPNAYPFDLPWLTDEFELEFTEPVTVICGENGKGKSTLIEAIAALSGYDEAGGGKGYRPVDHSKAIDKSGPALGDALRAGWVPKVTDGWFFRAESFFSVARYLDAAGSPSADFLSYSHGEGFLRFLEERMARQGICFMDEPESALSPKRPPELPRALHSIQQGAVSQVIVATHSPILIAVPGATLLSSAIAELTRFAIGIASISGCISPSPWTRRILSNTRWRGHRKHPLILPPAERVAVASYERTRDDGDMAMICVDTQFGRLGITERDGAVVAVVWDGENEGTETPLLREAAAQMRAYDEGRLERFDLPLRVTGSAFQRAVCAAMLAIPFGHTRTYGEIARDLGAPAQAVGGACGGNPIPVIIPCHRVMGARGLTGFSGKGGVETKVALLRHEGAAGLLI